MANQTLWKWGLNALCQTHLKLIKLIAQPNTCTASMTSYLFQMCPCPAEVKTCHYSIVICISLPTMQISHYIHCTSSDGWHFAAIMPRTDECCPPLLPVCNRPAGPPAQCATPLWLQCNQVKAPKRSLTHRTFHDLHRYLGQKVH